MNDVNDKVNNVYQFLKDYIENYNYPPSVREICKALNIKSTASVYDYLEKLQDAGLIIKSPDKKRAYKLVKLDKDNSNLKEKKAIPVIGTVAAGFPIFAKENIEEYCYLPNEFKNENDELFILKVKGNSMIEAGILNGDKVIIKKQETAENGDKVIALIDDSATLKTFYKKNQQIILHPENSNMKDMIFDNVIILGVAIGLYRKF